MEAAKENLRQQRYRARCVDSAQYAYGADSSFSRATVHHEERLMTRHAPQIEPATLFKSADAQRGRCRDYETRATRARVQLATSFRRYAHADLTLLPPVIHRHHRSRHARRRPHYTSCESNPFSLALCLWKMRVHASR